MALVIKGIYWGIKLQKLWVHLGYTSDEQLWRPVGGWIINNIFIRTVVRFKYALRGFYKTREGTS